MNKKTIMIVIAIIVGVIGFLVLTQPKEEAAGTPSEHKIGAGTTGVTLVEYGDFQCPGCGSYYPILKQVKEYYGDKITFQFRHFPLETIHKNARAAARAAEAAGMQGKFWEMHNKIYENQAQWENASNPVSIFEGYADSIGLNKEKFATDYKNSEVSATISADLKAGRELGVDSTPTFFLNGQKLDPNPSGFEQFKELIDAKITELSKNSDENQEKPEQKQSENTDAQKQKETNTNNAPTGQ